MKAILLCGGFAKRLWPLTLDRPKSLLDVSGKPMLDYIVDKVECLQDVDEIIISSNAAFEPAFRTWLNSRTFTKPTRLVIEPSHSEGEKFGCIRGLHWLLETSKIDEDCMVINGDNLFDFGLDELVRFHKKVGTPVIAVYDANDIEKAKQQGVVELDGTRIVELHEKSPSPPSTLLSTGCYIFPRSVLGAFGKYLEGKNNGDSMGYFVAWLIKQTAVHGWSWNGTWFDIGDFVSLEKARQWASKQK